VRLKHVSRGQDVNGTLQSDVIVDGRVPTLAETSTVRVLPYVEHLVQSGAGASAVTMTTLLLIGFSPGPALDTAHWSF